MCYYSWEEICANKKVPLLAGLLLYKDL